MVPRQISYLLLAGLFLEIVGLEVAPQGLIHHLWDGSALAIYAFTAGQIHGRRRVAWLTGCLGGIAWGLDFIHLSGVLVDVESAFWAAIHLVLAWVLAHQLFSTRSVNAAEILEAISLYVVVAIAFANLYGIVLWSFPGAITYPDATPGVPPSLDRVLYYSFITQLTVGYGDMAPSHSLTRILSIFQAFFGVMYVSILIARFVSMHTATPAGTPSPERGDEE